MKEEVKLFMRREFNPVGQGAFYTERFKDGTTVIYDCGSVCRGMDLEEMVASEFKNGERIEAIFISHLHEDHVNLLPIIMKRCNVKKIYLPLVSETHKLYMKVYLEMTGTSEVALQLLEDPIQYIQGMQNETETEVYMVGDTERDSRGYIYNGRNVASGILSSRREESWVYIPFNFCQSDRILELKYALLEEFGRDISEKELNDFWTSNDEEKQKKIKSAYKRVKGDFNTNSMTVYSGPSIENRFLKCGTAVDCAKAMLVGQCIRQCIRQCNNRKLPGCLYLGDYNASDGWGGLQKAYKEYWEIIGCVQIPHHGSKYSFNDEILCMNAFFVVSAGRRNSYSHPHADVMRKFAYANKHLNVVSESSDSAYVLDIELDGACKTLCQSVSESMKS